MQGYIGYAGKYLNNELFKKKRNYRYLMPGIYACEFLISSPMGLAFTTMKDVLIMQSFRADFLQGLHRSKSIRQQ